MEYTYTMDTTISITVRSDSPPNVAELRDWACRTIDREPLEVGPNAMMYVVIPTDWPEPGVEEEA